MNFGMFSVLKVQWNMADFENFNKKAKKPLEKKLGQYETHPSDFTKAS